jgi:hypothetical protein
VDKEEKKKKKKKKKNTLDITSLVACGGTYL